MAQQAGKDLTEMGTEGIFARDLARGKEVTQYAEPDDTPETQFVSCELEVIPDPVRTALGGLDANRPAYVQPPHVEADRLMTILAGYFDHYARFASEAQRDAVTLWTAAAHCRGADGLPLHESAPRLLLLSSEPGSGKSRVLKLARNACGTKYPPLTEPTSPAILHMLGKVKQPVFLDEADVLFGRGQRKEAIRAILNAGYDRDGIVPHMKGEQMQDIPCFGYVALAGLDVMRTSTGASLEPLFTRSIVVRMRKSKDAVPALRARSREQGTLLHEALARWAIDQRGDLETEVDMPDWLYNRDGQVWEPLLAVGRNAGGEWWNRAMAAARELTRSPDEQVSGDEAALMADLEKMAAEWTLTP